MESAAAAAAGDASPPVSNGERVQPSPVSLVPSEGGDMTTAAILDRTIELARLILDEVGRRGLDPDLLRLSDGRLGAVVPASSEDMTHLRETTVAETREEECAVCWESYEEGDKMSAMPCSHAFHDGCIRRWLAISSLCPLCRFSLQAQAGPED
ncbi:hypothetical protein HU200_030368 [Digitaria exilis]|uniref:RING-type domain-containing protein n=1 Tax=Digitaria exilis TaxID=1010633 RepID=A0A835C0D1_9POAL|nr:hypothetical protein HU200_030368 [Digitaria exilis]